MIRMAGGSPPVMSGMQASHGTRRTAMVRRPGTSEHVSLASVTSPGGHLYVLCFSDIDPEAAGPHPVSRQELSAPFTPSSGWSIASISPERLQARFAPEGAPAWLAKIERIEPGD
jgi:hypothetical protein